MDIKLVLLSLCLLPFQGSRGDVDCGPTTQYVLGQGDTSKTRTHTTMDGTLSNQALDQLESLLKTLETYRRGVSPKEHDRLSSPYRRTSIPDLIDWGLSLNLITVVPRAKIRPLPGAVFLRPVPGALDKLKTIKRTKCSQVSPHHGHCSLVRPKF